jgi:histidinol dehydrogenase
MRVKVLRSNEVLEAMDRGADKGPGPRLEKRVRDIIARIRTGGAQALGRIARELGDPPPRWLPAGDRELERLAAGVPPEGRAAMERAAGRVRLFARAVMASVAPVDIAVDGLRLSTRLRPVRAACCYAPGGRFPLFSSAIMTAIPAREAGVGMVSLCTPRLTPGMALAAELAGVDGVAVAGGAQAVAAAAWAVPPLPGADIFAGPGNAWVTEAKRQLSHRMGTDMPAGPSEVAVIADSSADAERISLDLLAQAEHAPDASAWLLTDSQALAAGVARLMERPGELCPRMAREGLGNVRIGVMESLPRCSEAADALAPEHLEIVADDAREILEGVDSFGAAFIGGKCCVALGDYAAGPSHTLPTGGAARFASALSPLAFLRLQTVTEAGGGPQAVLEDAAVLASMEGMEAHAESCRLRLEEGMA